MANTDPRPKSLISFALLSLAIGFVWTGCNRPPTRSFVVKMGNQSGDLKGGKSDADTEDSDTNDDTETTDPVDDKDKGDDPDQPVDMDDPKDPVNTDPKVDPVDPVVTEPEKPKPEDPKTLVECTKMLSVGRIHQWHATQEGVMIPNSGLIVVKEGTRNVAKVEFVGEGWHVVPVWLKNAYEAEVDLSKSKNFTITYSATADVYVQLRPSFAWSGGDKWAAKIPSTGGEVKTLTVSFEDAASWTALLGPVPHTLNEARAKARGFVFVGNKPTKFAVTSLLIDGYEPPCE